MRLAEIRFFRRLALARPLVELSSSVVAVRSVVVPVQRLSTDKIRLGPAECNAARNGQGPHAGGARAQWGRDSFHLEWLRRRIIALNQ